jgi:hypothetical protein
MVTFGGTVTNDINATMVFGSLITSENITNNGDISCTSWTHGSGIADGVTGKYCVSTCFMNMSTITGTIDVCDASPSGLCDLQMGTITGTVTFCTSGTCADNTGIDEQFEEFSLYPNPSKESIYIQNGEFGNTYFISNCNGQLIQKGIVDSGNINIDQLEKGIYFFNLEHSNSRIILKFIKE